MSIYDIETYKGIDFSVLNETQKTDYSNAAQCFKEITVGSGTDIFKTNGDGSFWGAVKFATAPAKVGFDGEAEFSKVTIKNSLGTTLFSSTGGLTSDAILGAIITAAMTNIAAINPVDGEINANKIGTLQLVAGAVVPSKITSYNFQISEGSFTNNSPTAGKITWAGVKVVYNGVEYSIVDGSCLATDKHVYWQLSNPTALQGSATLPALGNNDFLVLFNNSGTAVYVWNSTIINGNRITSGSIVASNLAANTITANEIAAGTITATELNTALLYAGVITLDTGGAIKSGKTAYTDDTHAGFWLGNVSGTPKFNIGVSASKYLHYDGSDLILLGGTISGGTIQTNPTSSGANTRLSGSVNNIDFRYNDSSKAYIIASSDGSVMFDCDAGMYLVSNDEMYIEYNENGGSESILWVDDGNWAMQLHSNHDLDIEGDVSAANFDFAELFESIEEFSKEKIPNGTPVIVIGDKIRPAKSGEIPIGVISATAGIVLNNGGSDAGSSWGKKYIRDEFGKKQYEEEEWWYLPKIEERTIKRKTKNLPVKGWVKDGNVPVNAKTRMKRRLKLNSEYDKTKKYIPRKERPEWNIVGLIGRCRLLKGSPVDPRWIKLKDISDTVEEWLIR